MTTRLEEKITQQQYNRGRQFVPQGVDGYDECWYPICLSSEVEKGQVKGFDFLNGKVIVFRSSSGELSVTSPYCRHLGVDLSIADVIGGKTLRCPYHHWEYDQTGQCVKTGVGDTPPSRAKLFKFPVDEYLGLIRIYNGKTPSYDAPVFPVDESELEFTICRAAEVPMDPFMLFSNTMDLQHLISLHGATFDKFPEKFDISERTIAYTQDMVIPGIGGSRQHVKLHGTNCITLCSDIKGRDTFMMSSGLAVTGPLTKTFNISATLKTDSKPTDKQPAIKLMDQFMNKIHIRLVDAFGKKLNAEDAPAFETISPRLDNLTEKDKALSIYFDFARNYPRSNIAEDLICNDYIKNAPGKRVPARSTHNHPL